MLRAGDLLPEHADVQVSIGNLFLAVDRFDDARARADQVLKRHPQNVRALILRGNALAGLKDLDNALKDMQQAISADPTNAVAFIGVGAVQRARGDLSQAEDAFRQALEVRPDSADIRLSYAHFLMAGNRRADAERELQQAYAIDAGSVMVNRALAGFYIVTNRHAEAETHLKKLADAKESASWAGFALARFYAVTRRPEDAVHVLQGLINRTDVGLEAKLQLAALIYNRGERDEAHRLVDQVLAVMPKEPRALVLKAGFLLDEDKTDEAIKTARLARQNSRAAQAALLLGFGYSKLGQIDNAKKAFTDALTLDARSVVAPVELSRLSLSAGDTSWAQRYGEMALRANPQLPAAREAVVRAALARNDVAAANPVLASLRRDRPDNPEYLHLEGELRLLEGKRAAAREAFARAAAVEPQSLAPAEALIRLDLSEGNVPAARARADGLVAKAPESVPALLLAARTYATTRDFVRAEAFLRRAIDLHPDHADPYGMLANLYVAQRKLDQALTQFEEAARRDPASVGARTMVAMVLTRMGRRAEAKEAYRQVLAIDPDAAFAANNLAFLYAEDGEKLDVALQLAETAKRLMPDSADALDTLGWVYYQRKMPNYAISELESAVAKAPQNHAYRYHLGLAYASGADAARARPTLEQALKSDPASPFAAPARTALAALK
jgi:tetratricopeptide (TPR) repeat protein